MLLLMIKLLFLLTHIYLTTCLPDNRQSPIFVGTFTEQIVERGIRLSLKCSAKGNPLPQITWKQDDQPINEAYHIRIGDYVSDVYTVNSYVNISSTKTDDGGFYSCKASNIAGSLQHTARINVLGPPFIRPMANLTVLSAQNIQITCPYSGYPIKSVTWLRDGRKLPQNHRQKVFLNGTFVINNVEKGADAGQYQCAVTDEDGRTAKRDLFINVVVSPIVQPFSFPVDLVSGRRAGVACIVSAGDLPIRITWLKDGAVIPESLMPMVDTKDFTSFLTFDKVSRSHRGNYTCLAENPASTSNYTAPLIVQVPPSWIVEPKDKSVIKGNSLTLDCQADGSPRPIIRWKKSTDGEDFKVVISNAHIQTLENGSLTIREVAKEDAGHYMCQAMNGIGPGASMVVKVTVAVAAHFEKKFETHTVNLGQDLTIRCVAIGDKDIQITWSRDRKLINSNNEPRYIFEQIEKTDRTESIFKIRTAERRDSALFTCHAENNYGKDNSNFQIVVQESPDCPVDLKAEDVGSRSFALTWSHPFNGNSPILSYLLEYKPSKFYSYSTSKGVNKEVLPVTGVSHVIKGLEPQTTYLVTLSAQNGLGTSSECLPLSVTTDGEAPTGAPRDIKVVPISSTSLQVNWKPPAVSEQNGPILGYYVGYRQQRSPEEFSYKTIDATSPSFSYSTTLSSLPSMPSPASSSSSFPSSLEDKNFEESCQINGLRKLTRYLIIVQAYNKKGAGPPSDQIEAQTLEYDPPEAPTLKVVSTTFNSALLSWDINDDIPLDPMSGYIVYHKVEKGDWEEISIYADKLKYNIKNLSCGKRYQFYIVPFNSAGKGQPSEVVSAKTLGTAPIAPDLHDLLTVNSTFALINLTSWTSGGCPILNFNVQYKVKHSREYILVSTNIIPDQRMVILSDLSPATWYNVFITAHNEAGSTGAEYTFGTLTASGEPIPYPSQENLEDLAHQLKIVMPLASALVVLTLILGVICAMFKKRQNFHANQQIPGDGVACDGNKSCESMPLSDWDNTAKRHSLRNSNSDEPTMDFFASTNNLKGNRHLTGVGVTTGGTLIPNTTSTGSTANESIYFPSPYALSRISAYERSLNNEGRSHPQHQLIVNGAPNSHTYDVPHKKCLINPGNPNHGTYWDKINPRNIV
uniref:MDscam12 n=1 Tax=Tetranychus urticae TaxID=32264 RepID=A0A2Z4EFJ1_TETUR|nr:mDscam12 [Tetranychus urticae]